MERYTGGFLGRGVLIGLSLMFATNQVFANSPPVVSDVRAYQRHDGTGIVFVTYKLSDADNDKCTITMLVSDDGGSTWAITPSATALSGHIRCYITPGNRSIEWRTKKDLPGEYGENYCVKVIADDGYIQGMEWVYINDPGVSGHEGFTGYMSKYETTNAQYCKYLNAAISSGDITVSGSYVVGVGGTYSGQNYYNFTGTGDTYNGAIYGGASRINWTGSSFTVGQGFENHPVTYVSWYGATAFAAYYGWRLPTEWEWQAVSDYNCSYTYGTGTTINNSIANYYNSTHPHGTTPVGQYGTFGYGLADMAGNVWEWTSSLWDSAYSYRVLRGGSWRHDGSHCTVSHRLNYYPSLLRDSLGFRVCR